MSKNNNLKNEREEKEQKKYWKENVFKSVVEVKRNKNKEKKIKHKKELENATNCCRFS